LITGRSVEAEEEVEVEVRSGRVEVAVRSLRDDVLPGFQTPPHTVEVHLELVRFRHGRHCGNQSGITS
jgi:hypothetical protein